MESTFNSPRIALTGGIACGKSLFAKFLRELGVQTLDADDIVHELIPDEERRRLAPIVFSDPAARKALEARIHPIVRDRIDSWFSAPNAPNGLSAPNALNGSNGLNAFNGSNGLNAFNGSNGLNGLNAFNGSNGLKALKALNSSMPNPPLRLAIIPLLFECNWDADYDIIICISSPAEEQIRRMVETRGLTREAAEARLNAQLPVSEKAARSQYVVCNDSTVEHLHEEAMRCVTWLRSRQS